MNRNIKALMALSLLLNLLLGGIVFGHIVQRLGHHERETALATMAPEKRRLVEQALEKAYAQNDALRQEMRRTREAMGEALKAEPFNEAAYDAMGKKLQKLRARRSQLLADAFKALARELTPRERAALSELMQHPPGRMPPH